MKVALQFPDELLRDSVPIYHNLKRAIGADKELYVLADTSYGRQAFRCPNMLSNWRFPW
jgi:diphthamide biosynthesis protein 2